MTANIYLGDCMDGLTTGKKWDLAIVDPPYGIDRDGGETGKNWKVYEDKGWDKKRPDKSYFEKLLQVSGNQIIWGANYFTEYLPASMGWVFWDKGQDLTMSDGELAFSSFQKALRRVVMNRCKIGEFGGLLHPTQKPVALYKWLLKNYAKPGDTILDTHGGSMSIVLACIDMGFDIDIWEKDPDYYFAAKKRIENHVQQLPLFGPPPVINFIS